MRVPQNRIGCKTAHPYDVFRLDVVDWCGGLSRFGPCRLYPPAITTISRHIKGAGKWRVGRGFSCWIFCNSSGFQNFLFYA